MADEGAADAIAAKHKSAKPSAADAPHAADDEDAGGSGSHPPLPRDESPSSDDDDDDDCDGVPFDEADHAGGRARYSHSGAAAGQIETTTTTTTTKGATAKRRNSPPPNPYVGRLVAVVRGRHRGARGVVRTVQRGGWWSIGVVAEESSVATTGAAAAAAAAAAGSGEDGASSAAAYRPTGATIKVQNNNCQMLDPVTVEEVDAYNEATGAFYSFIRPYLAPPDGGAVEDGDDDDDDNDDDEDGHDDDEEDGDDKDGTRKRHRHGDRGYRKRRRRGSAAAAADDVSGSSYYRRDEALASVDRDVLWTRLQPPDGCPPSWRDWRESLPPHVLERLAEMSVPPPAVRAAGRTMPRRTVVASSTDPEEDSLSLPATKLAVDPTVSQSLPPVVLPSPPDDDDGTSLASVPRAVRHLPLESKVDIFDRKTGRVLSGQSAVRVRDLAAVLRTHASYEPIVPPPTMEEAADEAVAEAAKRAVTVRQGRTAPNITVSATVEPQCRVRASAMEGREVIVTEGRLRGLVGKIEACLPGGWYVVSDLLGEPDQEIEHVVSSASLDLLESSQLSSESPVSSPSKGDGALPSANHIVKSFQSTVEKLYSNPMRQMTLRLEAMEKEKERIASLIGVDINGKIVDLDKTKSITGLHGLRIHQLQQRWEKLDKDIEDMKTKLNEHKSAGKDIRVGLAASLQHA